MAPKLDARGKPVDPKARNQAPPVPQVSFLDRAFPLWLEPGKEKDEKEAPAQPNEKYEDIAGLALPPETQMFLDTWKRPEELVLNSPDVPMVLTMPLQQQPEMAGARESRGKNAPVVTSRELEGTLSAGHRTFDWLQAVFVMVISAQKAVKPGEYLWELIYPKDKDGQATKSQNGKYKIKLFIMDAWRTVFVDDRIPVDLFGRPLLVNARPIQLWPLLLSKAVLKVLAAQRILHCGLPHQAAAFQLLTGWPQEDLLDPLSGTRLSGGRAFDRLEDAVRGNEERAARHAVAAVTLIKRALPTRPPPRLIVLVGPSGVGRGALLRRLVNELPDKFGLTVSHTTRPPREHEVSGSDYFFMEVTVFREEAAAGRLLESAPVPSTRGTHLYGTSFATVREVAATGKLCLMGLDVQGVRSLRANKRIDGLYVFVAPPSLEELERRQRARLKEAESTIAKRLAWAASEIERSQPGGGVIDNVVENVDDSEAVYLDVKEAISTLSPIIRNRLHGLPAYVLDYADLIAPNLVEKPFLKPVVITGPTTGERRAIMEQLVHEFPDVFAYPRYTTTKPHHEEALYRVDAPEPPEQPQWEVIKSKDGEDVHVSRPTHASVPPSEFTASAQAGTFLEWHTDLFKHPLVARQWGVTAEAIKEVIRAGRLPLIECETEGAEMLKKRGIDCLTIFLKPPSVQVFEARLRQYLTETDEEIAARIDMARREMEAASAPGNPFDASIVIDDPQAAYDQLTRLISRCRPDIIVPEEERQAEPPPPPKQPVLVLCGPAAGGRSALAKQLISTFPDKFTAPGLTTDRKPGKGEVSTPALTFVAPKDLSRMAAEGQIAYQRAGDDKGSGNIAISNAALLRVAAENKVAVMEVPDYITALPTLRNGTVLKDALYVFVASPGQLREALEMQQREALARSKSVKGGAAVPGAKGPGLAAPLDLEGALADLDQQAQIASSAASADLYDVVVRADEMIDLISTVRIALASHVPHVVPQPYRPLVLAGAFGTGKRKLLARLFDALPGRFAVPVITTTHQPGPNDPDPAREGMVVVDRAEAEAIMAAEGFALHKEVMGDVYGTELAAVKKVAASGRVPILEVDHVADAVELRRRGFDATYMFVGMEDMGKLLSVIQEELSSNPPLGYELQDAVNLFFATAKAETLASREEGVFDEWVVHAPDAPDPSFIRLAEAVHRHYPDVVTRHFVWGYGRQLWDLSVRSHGLRPLCVMVLGPAAAGKSTLCDMLAGHFGMPHVNVGDLIFEEVRQRTALGLEAKEYMDASKTVPDRIFFAVLRTRLAEPDCVARGWVLDGFPHTRNQCAELEEMGIIPDKVLFLEGEHATLLDRTRYRRYDPVTGKVYHVPDEGVDALSPAIIPEKPDGTPDAEVMARLVSRHDDSEENVMARLKLADDHYGALRDAFADISLRLSSTSDPRQLFQRALDYLTLEARMPELQVIPSTSLKELQYLVAATLRYRRRQLLQLQQDDGRLYWVDATEVLGSNAYCALLCQDPSIFATSHQLRRVDTNKLSRVALLYVDSPEPVKLLSSLFTGPQYGLMEDPPTPRNVLVLSGPAGVGKSTVLRMLLRALGTQLELVPVLTSRPPLRREPSTNVTLRPPAADGTGGEVAEGRAGLGPTGREPLATACCVSTEALDAAAASDLLLGVCEGWDGHRYGVPRAALQAAWAAGKLAVIEAPLEVALALRELASQQIIFTSPPATPSGPHSTAGTGTGTGALDIAAAAGGPDGGAAGAVLTPRVVYLTAELSDLDIRLRIQDQREESAVGQCLEAAQREAAMVQRLIKAAESPTPVSKSASRLSTPQSRVPTPATPQTGKPATPLRQGGPPAQLPLDLILTDTDPVVSFHAAKQLAADNWRRPRAQAPGQLVLEAYDWRSPGGRPGRTVQRLRTLMANAALLELPRGKHLLRINSDPLFLHAVTFMSASPCTVGEYNQVMPMHDSAVHVASQEGRHPDMPPDSLGLLFRYNLNPTDRATVAAHLSINGEDMRAATRLLLVDRASGEAKLLPGNRLHATELAPAPSASAASGGSGATAGGGYCLMALYDTSTRGVAEEGNYCLTVTSTGPLPAAVLSEVPSARSDEFVETYRPNARLVLGRTAITTTNTCQVAILATTEPRLPFRMTLQEAPPGREITWLASVDYPVLASSSSNEGVGLAMAEGPAATPEGYALIPDATLKPGKYLIACTIDAKACPVGMQPDPRTGAMPGGKPIKLKVWVHPSADEKVVTVISDNSLARYVQGVYDKWNAAPVQLIAQPPAGTVTSGKGGKGGSATAAGNAPADNKKAYVGSRSSIAAAILEKYKAEQVQQKQPEQQQQAVAGGDEGTPAGIEDGAPAAPPGTVSRVLKDGSVLNLDPTAQLQVLRDQPPVRLTAAQLAGRQTSAMAAAADGAVRLESVGKALEASKGERAGFRARQASNFAEWRASMVRAQREAASRRAEVLQSIKAGVGIEGPGAKS
ncbi:adenylate kinase [Volvox carteri f. nagariensis]|uniref:adenylate kinase n=1 Tax=Volvox carteri f. nagariensis TaxID=3068 RepID=D8UHG2_VOLCA|nr:adenylate kinase [Volvox carteri f. nagariensis]EFJ40819.1 adenylate kinase [Volvox carteri f. nagariensis]|eukprot:XP_002958088.1 adenylate kinase [Volvox carteri f. nagariensis]